MQTNISTGLSTTARRAQAVILIAILSIALLVAPRPSAHAAPVAHGQEQATLAAGCFWSMEAMYKQLKGVINVVPGYAGGTAPNPTYEFVETGSTGYAETVNITFDPAVISYGELVRVLLTARDPTSLNYQGNDVGPQYRSVIFYRSPQQKAAAESVIHQITGQRLWSKPIVTAVVPFTAFHEAEAYHHNYYALHPDEPYCAEVIAPELDRFRKEFRADLKS